MTACSAQANEDSGSAKCNAKNAQVLIGQKLTSQLSETAQMLSGSRFVRRLGPDSIPTMDVRRDRVNITVDSNGIVTSITCG
jgi:hypothetical protein